MQDRKEYLRAWRQANKEKTRKYRRDYVARNPEKVRAEYADWRAEFGDVARAAHAAWKKNNPDAVRAHVAKRRAAQARALPAWADTDKIREIYAECVRISADTGIPHHVDHIVPINSPIVCGLHVSHNLQIIPASQNMRKSNKFEVI